MSGIWQRWPLAADYAGEPEAIGDNLWRQRHRASGRWHRFKLGAGEQRHYFLRNEAHWLRQLSGLPLARCHGLAEVDETLLLVTDHLPGETLATLMRRQGGRLEAVLPVFRQLFTVLERCHRQGVVHGDLKPGNLLWDGERLHLLDVAAAARWGTELASLPYRAFSPSYSLPCQQQGAGRVAPAMDWYAYLVMLRLALGGDLARPKWSRVRPASDCFADWVAASGLPDEMRSRLIWQICRLDAGDMSSFGDS